MGDRFEGLGVTERELAEGTLVMVPVGQGNALVNGQPCIIAMARVLGPAGDAAVSFVKPESVYWLDVYAIPGGEPLPQMYPADQILGIPALGLTMQGVPEPEIRFT